MSDRFSARARGSLVFKLWSLALALVLGVAGVAGPVLSYLADSEKINSEVDRLRGVGRDATASVRPSEDRRTPR